MLKAHWFPVLLFLIFAVLASAGSIRFYRERKAAEESFAAYRAAHPIHDVWHGDNQYQIPVYSDSGKLIWYGRELIANTAYYLGPKGTVAKISNGLNCQNCHIDAGTAPYGNNFGKVYAVYPQYRARNNRLLSIYDRIDGCMERSMNGRPMDSASHEMRALYAYFKWLGEDVPKGEIPEGTGISKLPYPDMAADPVRGEQVYRMNCQSCHGDHGQGQPNVQGYGYTYPPLWGPHSYNDGAGLYRIGNFAGFVKDNMPFGTDYLHPRLTDGEAWDVAAYVNSQPRPHKDQSGDWADIRKKPVDFPFGPYADSFSEKQHKYGPFKPILEARGK